MIKIRFSVFAETMKAGDIVVHEFRSGRVVTHDDEHRWNSNVLSLPEVVNLFVVTVKRVERSLQFNR